MAGAAHDPVPAAGPLPRTDPGPGKDAPGDRAWPLWLAWARLVLALLYLAAQLHPGGQSGWASRAVPVTFALYALAVLAWKYKDRASAALLSLCIDTIFFLVFARFQFDYWMWLEAAFYFYLLLAAVTVHRWMETCLVAAVSIGFLLVVRSENKEPLLPIVLFAGLLACVLAFEKHRAAGRLAERSREADELRARLGKAVDAERQRTAGDFHDGPLQNFIGLQMRIEVLRRMLERNPESGMKELLDLQGTVRSQVRELRSFLRALRPAEVAGNDLTAAMREAVTDFQKDSGVSATFQSGGTMDQEASGRYVEVLQIVREALHNVHKHARATRVAVTASRAGSAVELAIDDNGVGFSFSGAYNLEEMETLGIGPGSIKRRVRGLGGELTVESRPGRGAAIRIRIPA